jgi:hypothetical protein
VSFAPTVIRSVAVPMRVCGTRLPQQRAKSRYRCGETDGVVFYYTPDL